MSGCSRLFNLYMLCFNGIDTVIYSGYNTSIHTGDN